jgi:hypothetical protein
MLNAAEYQAGIKSTKAFIEADVDVLDFDRRTKTPDLSGGWTMSLPISFGPIRCRLIPQSDQVPEVSTSDGRSLRPTYVLMALPTEDLQRYDRFTKDGKEYELAAIHAGPMYELKADVVLYG